MRISKEDRAEHGYTDGCEMCDHSKRYGCRETGARHTEACRSRLMSKFGQTEAGELRLQTWSDKVDKTIAERIEHEDQLEDEKVQPRPAINKDDTLDEAEVDVKRAVMTKGRARTTDDLGSISGTPPSIDEPAMATLGRG